MCVGSALDILLAGQPPRATFIDYPLGHTAGKPFDRADQLAIMRASLSGLMTMTAPGEVRILPQRWEDAQWKLEAAATSGEDTRQPRDETPQFQLPADLVAAIASGASRSV